MIKKILLFISFIIGLYLLSIFIRIAPEHNNDIGYILALVFHLLVISLLLYFGIKKSKK
ncbi:hypothetical protein [uncultured Tenacibaculum sp.]|uniref:hypothetical protein n=1 Tax=uncultured Tenacibaculum sp. TaxID=174713 RepID=UPI00260DE871|nr:hypothetical protein [uncultured Tenacibaculum sp.]